MMKRERISNEKFGRKEILVKWSVLIPEHEVKIFDPFTCIMCPVPCEMYPNCKENCKYQ